MSVELNFPEPTTKTVSKWESCDEIGTLSEYGELKLLTTGKVDPGSCPPFCRLPGEFVALMPVVRERTQTDAKEETGGIYQAGSTLLLPQDTNRESVSLISKQELQFVSNPMKVDGAKNIFPWHSHPDFVKVAPGRFNSKDYAFGAMSDEEITAANNLPDLGDLDLLLQDRTLVDPDQIIYDSMNVVGPTALISVVRTSASPEKIIVTPEMSGEEVGRFILEATKHHEYRANLSLFENRITDFLNYCISCKFAVYFNTGSSDGLQLVPFDRLSVATIRAVIEKGILPPMKPDNGNILQILKNLVGV